MSCDKIMADLDIDIRPARMDDLEGLRTLDHAVFGDLAYPPFVLRQFFDVYQDGWLVAEEPSGGLAGYSLCVPTLDRQLAWLLGLAVTPEYRNLGIGTRLTLRSLEFLRSLGIPRVHLTVEPANEVAIALYRKIGFSVTTMRHNYLGPGEHRVIMVHTFTRSTAIPSPRPTSIDPVNW